MANRLTLKERQKELEVGGVSENSAAIVAALHDMLRQSWDTDATSSGHATESSQIPISPRPERFHAIFAARPA